MTETTVSIVIVNYNGKTYVDKCLASVFSSNLKDYEVIVVDNGSTDGSVDFLKKKYADHGDHLRTLSLENNLGPAEARNRGAALAKGRYLGFLDNDTVVHPDWAVKAIERFDRDPTLGILQCKLLLLKEPTKIDYVGEYLGQNGFLVQRAPAGAIDDGSYDRQVEILAAKSAGMFIKKEAFDKAGGFDGDYFIYVEETDLGWRSWLAGYRAEFAPESIVYHEFGTSAIMLGKAVNNYNAKFHGTKNYILTLLKNLDGLHLIRILPVHIFLWFGLSWFSLLRGDGRSFLWINQGIFWNLRHLPRNIEKRRLVQGSRVVSDPQLFSIILKKKPFAYFVQKVLSREKIGNAEGFFKSR